MSETIIEQLLVEVRDGHEGADARLFEAVRHPDRVVDEAEAEVG